MKFQRGFPNYLYDDFTIDFVNRCNLLNLYQHGCFSDNQRIQSMKLLTKSRFLHRIIRSS